jgi:hypothetical protein
VGIAGCRWYLPINGTTNSSWAVKPTGHVETIGIGDARPLAVTLPPGLAAKWLPLRPGQSPARLARVHQCLAPNGRMHFVGVKFVPIMGE